MGTDVSQVALRELLYLIEEGRSHSALARWLLFGQAKTYRGGGGGTKKQSGASGVPARGGNMVQSNRTGEMLGGRRGRYSQRKKRAGGGCPMEQPRGTDALVARRDTPMRDRGIHLEINVAGIFAPRVRPVCPPLTGGALAG